MIVDSEWCNINLLILTVQIKVYGASIGFIGIGFGMFTLYA